MGQMTQIDPFPSPELLHVALWNIIICTYICWLHDLPNAYVSACYPSVCICTHVTAINHFINDKYYLFVHSMYVHMYIKVYHLIEITSTLILTHRQAYPSQSGCTWPATSSCALQTPSPTGCTTWVPHTTSSWRQPGRSSGPGQSLLCRPPSGGEKGRQVKWEGFALVAQLYTYLTAFDVKHKT